MIVSPVDTTGILLLAGFIFSLFGALYLRNPTIYRRGIWLKTSIAIRVLSEQNYIRYMRGLGFVFLVGGATAFLIGIYRTLSN